MGEAMFGGTANGTGGLGHGDWEAAGDAEGSGKGGRWLGRPGNSEGDEGVRERKRTGRGR